MTTEKTSAAPRCTEQQLVGLLRQYSTLQRWAREAACRPSPGTRFVDIDFADAEVRVKLKLERSEAAP